MASEVVWQGDQVVELDICGFIEFSDLLSDGSGRCQHDYVQVLVLVT